MEDREKKNNNRRMAEAPTGKKNHIPTMADGGEWADDWQ